ncbi:MAG TPA: molybdopterin-binding protein [Burkholderiaceae bacterium]|jgi:DMSO/TMAO reductase YedYZ molybdopterin-dependent catalytic subunit|nr:molybdopterin-binding protein [Burkholderiaceae bacterium]
MTTSPDLRRRQWLKFASGAGALALAGCDRLSVNPQFDGMLRHGEAWTMRTQRLLLAHQPLAREFAETELSPHFRANGSLDPDSADYRRLAANQFADWRLQVTGLVQRPLQISLAQIKALASRTQVTRHDCVEGWSAIGKWQGVPLSRVLDLAGLQPGARYVVFRCADELEKTASHDGFYYESIDLLDAYHPQTILAYAMNGQDLPIAHGAPLRLRVERQLGYKQAKYLMRLEVVDSFGSLYGGRGGFWEDRGYEWYGGI